MLLGALCIGGIEIASAAVYTQSFDSVPSFVTGIGGWDKKVVYVGPSAASPELQDGFFAQFDSGMADYLSGKLRVNSFLTQFSRHKKLSVLVDTSGAVPGRYTVSFNVESFTAGEAGTYSKFYLTEGNVNADGSAEFDLGLKSSANPAESMGVSSGVLQSICDGVDIVNGEFIYHFTLNEAGESGDFVLLSWVSGGGGSTAVATPSYTVDNVVLDVQTQFPLRSLETDYTIMRVRTGKAGGSTFIAAASYEGTVLRLGFDGAVAWENALGGYMVHDLWCTDLNGDQVDDVLVSNADGYLYCLNGVNGAVLWNFAPTSGPHKTPMYGACSIKALDGTKYVACGGFDKNFYWLSSSGQLLETVESEPYSLDRPWGDYNYVGYGHTVNWARPLPLADGSEALVLAGTMVHNVAGGHLYFFEPLAKTPYDAQSVADVGTVSDLRVCDPQGDGSYEFFLGGDGLTFDRIAFFNPDTDELNNFTIWGNGPNGYRITQGDVISDEGNPVYLTLSGTYINLIPLNLDVDSRETFTGTYAFNDLWKDPESGKVLLGSAQSGGSCIHIIDPSLPGWKAEFINLQPPGKIEAILDNTEAAWAQLDQFSKPGWERDPIDVYINKGDHPLADEISASYDSPVLFDGYWHGNHVQTTDWRYASDTYVYNDYYRTLISNVTYDRTEQDVLNAIIPAYDGVDVLSYWAGHGRDPNYYSPPVLRQILDTAYADGKKTILEWPELQSHDDNFKWELDNIMYPLGEYCATRDAWMVFKNKKTFWAADAYLPLWSRMVAGDFANVMVSSMEETSDKTQDMSLIGRIGLWAAGSMNRWGMRTSRDNPSFDRTRQFSYQRLPNHFLRTTVMNLACGASYCSLSYEDTDYYSILWPLVAKGALFVPKREEVVSFNPVHLSMVDPDELYLDTGRDGGWTIWYDEQQENDHPLVYSHQNMSWPGAAVTPWDYSRYASGVKDRRQNYIPSWPNGMVLVTPVQDGAYADPGAPRGKMKDHLHPLYADIMEEYITDGRDYISSDGAARYGADSYHTTVSNSIAVAARKLPVTVAGDVGWVCAQTAPNHLRLTLVDGGYLNPKDQVVTVTFNTVAPISITDVMDGKTFAVSGNTAQIDVPLGLWRFIDIELSEPFDPGSDVSDPDRGLFRDYWTGVPGSSVTDIPVGTTPTGADTVARFEATGWTDPSVTTALGNEYGQLIYGFLTPPQTGSYTFWVASDDSSELYISSDSNPGNAVLVASVSGYTSQYQWDKYASQKSASISLVAGRSYYVEVRHKDSWGGDHVAVGWAKPGESTTVASEVVPAQYLSTVPVGSGESDVGKRIEAENFDSQNGIQVVGGWKVGYVNSGDWICFNSMNLDAAASFSAAVASGTTGGTIEIRSGSISGSLLGSVSCWRFRHPSCRRLVPAISIWYLPEEADSCLISIMCSLMPVAVRERQILEKRWRPSNLMLNPASRSSGTGRLAI